MKALIVLTLLATQMAYAGIDSPFDKGYGTKEYTGGSDKTFIGTRDIGYYDRSDKSDTGDRPKQEHATSGCWTYYYK